MKTDICTNRKIKAPVKYKKYWQLYVFLLLPVLYIIVFAYGPMAGLQIAFKDFDVAKGIFGSPWAGVKYFKKFINSYQFLRIIRNTFVLSIYSLIARFPVPIILAICINVMQNKTMILMLNKM